MSKATNEEVPVSATKDIMITVVSGTPTFSMKPNGASAYTLLDLTAIDTYPFVIVTVSAGHYQFALSGAEVTVTPVNANR